MKFFSRGNRQEAQARILEERLFREAAKEVESNIIREGLWAKALANSEGNQDKSKALYLRYRVQSMYDELDMAVESAMEEQQRIEAENKKKYRFGNPEYYDANNKENT